MNQDKQLTETNDSESNTSNSEKNTSQKESKDDIVLELKEEDKSKRFWQTSQQGIRGKANGFVMFFKNPKEAIRLFFKRSTLIVYIIAILSGLVGAAAAWVFGNYITLTRILFYGFIYN
ncbi:MAG: hypothetical protein ACTSO7_06740, partial [Candidatus Heimdallarchaeota archaeon]